ncbi:MULTISPECIES: TrmH family RNA methyltransferase [unclassified Gordonia (in: high G+C Gram-positive bacteria)]|jgi:TrmH family RNA methyltransferase|uniref:TrmH family RNA methyltransferase n=1 Tax=Gordonia sp. VNQ95 TaxID=3156619 RepID=UPI0032B32BDA
MEILSERSSRVVSYAKLHRSAVRRAEQRFLVEGANAVVAALDTDRADQILVRDSDEDRFSDILIRARGAGIPTAGLTERAAQKLSETTTPPGIFAVSRLLDADLDDVLAGAPRLLAVAVEPREPGNAGTLIRTADAMGADAVLLLGDAVDPHNGKCVRASAGSVFHLPVVRHRDIAGTLKALQDKGIVLLATAADGELALDDAAEVLRGAVAWLFGNEAHGLPDDVATLADQRVFIPIRGRAESLNLAAAASICLYEGARIQARHPS